MRREDKALVLSQEGNVDAGKKYGGAVPGCMESLLRLTVINMDSVQLFSH